MSMLKKLKSVFIEEDSSGTPAPATPSNTKNKPPVSGKKTSDAVKPTGGKPTNKFIEMLLKAIETHNVEGFDYLEYKQSLQSLIKLEPDEAKRYKSAFAMASTMGLTKKILFDSAQRYANVLGEEEKKFADAFNKQKAVQVTERESRIKKLAQSIKNKEAQIKTLQDEIAKEQKELAGVESEIDKSMAKVEATRENFYGSYNLVLNQINDDIEKIQKYLD